MVPTGVPAPARLAAVVSLARRHAWRPVRSNPGPAPAPTVSVLVPAYDEAVGIAAALRSLVDTDYPGVEVVIGVDDGSTDDTAGIVERIR